MGEQARRQKNNKRYRKAEKNDEDPELDFIDNPILEKDFQRIYGVSYKKVAKILCPGERVKNDYLAKYSFDEKGDNSYQMFKRREHAKDKYKKIKDKYPTSSEVEKCFAESLNRADRLYVPGTGRCVAFKNYSQIENDSAFKGRQKDSVVAGDTHLLFNPGGCYIARQVDQDTGKTNDLGIGYADSGALKLNSDGTTTVLDDRYARMRIYDKSQGNLTPTHSLQVNGKTITGSSSLSEYKVSYRSDEKNCPSPNSTNLNPTRGSGK